MTDNPYYQGGPGWQRRSREHPHEHGTTGREAAYGDAYRRRPWAPLAVAVVAVWFLAGAFSALGWW